MNQSSISRRATLTGIAGTLALAAGSPAWAAKDKKAAVTTLSTVAEGEAKAATLFTRYGKASIAAGSRVLPVFQVELLEEDGAHEEDRKYHANATADSTFKVAGIDQAAVQAAVDTLYKQYIDALTAAGFVIVTDAEVGQAEAWRKLSANMKPTPMVADTGKRGKSTFYGPSGKGVYIAADDIRFSGKGGFAAFAQVGDAMGRATQEYALPTQLKAGVVGIELAVGFVQIKGEGGGKYSNIFGDGVVNIKGDAAMQVIPERSRLWFMPFPQVDGTKQQLVLNTTVLPAENPVLAFKDVTSKKAKLGDAAGMMIGFATGTGGSYSTKTYEITLDPVVLPKAMEQTLGGLTAGLVKRFTALPSEPGGKNR
ncbi:hypothetical protein PQU92_03245 [Asticcacaulis sp. BYS171W]|uniref:Uncharacterized protein n=1 Tax=Asticcacaulis aquaticus TaxID=2984212 RepID=A0ABT5HQE9_9CAUL|nr:hypothetical protein [Asticcacaulis aquaticus]MDC7682274.1 hypothetical protein [Asticcacaulis aquaticus]